MITTLSRPSAGIDDSNQGLPPVPSRNLEGVQIAEKIERESPERRALQRKMRILIVENNPDTANRLQRSLADVYPLDNIRIAGGLTPAYRAIESETPPDVIVLDLHLDNGSNGLTVFRYLSMLGVPCGVVINTAQAMRGTLADASQALDRMRADNTVQLGTAELDRARANGDYPVFSLLKTAGIANLVSMIDSAYLIRNTCDRTQLFACYQELQNVSDKVAVPEQIVHMFCEEVRNFVSLLRERVPEEADPRMHKKLDQVSISEALAEAEKKYGKLDFSDVKKATDAATYMLMHDMIGALTELSYKISEIIPELRDALERPLIKILSFGKSFKQYKDGEISLGDFLKLSFGNYSARVQWSLYEDEPVRIKDPEAVIRTALETILDCLQDTGEERSRGQIQISALNELQTRKVLAEQAQILANKDIGNCVEVKFTAQPGTDFDQIQKLAPVISELLATGRVMLINDRKEPNVLKLYIKTSSRVLFASEAREARIARLEKEDDNSLRLINNEGVVIGTSPDIILCEFSGGFNTCAIYADSDTGKMYFASASNHAFAAYEIYQYYRHSEGSDNKDSDLPLARVNHRKIRVNIYPGKEVVVDLEPEDSRCEKIAKFFRECGIPGEYLKFNRFNVMGDLL